ncbi:50S ribosomal protein L2 [Mucisphaera calidilacus]|uniref:Large ribosomal subunit protein uL2 n=1 Tax=Mucisphaera calidilacus TaxID=2527982 RepID=A0A518BXS0_9BACT|nr:50S ribosomal protein L2 [Mucisphaera calidilacus]QDU71773.1 50S ribosomal protein L2 [Mucisphaera calidilacus]
MAIRIYKRTTAGRRNASVNLYSEVTKKSPEKSLLVAKPKKGGRNHHGKITTQCRGGGAKKRYRKIDFRRRDKDGIEATVIGIEYDPNRSSNIALLEYADGEKRYILAPIGLKDGDRLVASEEGAEPKVGNSMPISKIPTGLLIHSVELVRGKGAQICRSAGSYARLSNREGRWATLVLPSGEIRQVPVEARATIGQVGNTDHNRVVLGKAGRARHLGKRPKTRGVARNHHDHPMGGGDGKSKGNRPPASKTGVLAKGGRTRKHGKNSNKRILRRRVSKRYGQLKLK